MKKQFAIFTIFMVLVTYAFSQAPKSFKYQAVIRDKNGVITNNVSLQISIIQDTSVGGTVVYCETFSAIKPNSIGMVNLDIGKGTIVTGNFSKIDWGNHKFYIGINMDPNGGSNYQAMGTSELLSVPYALYAATAGNSGSSNLNLTGTGSTTVTGNYPNYTINGGYQYLRASNDTIYITNGGFVKLPYIAGTGIGFTGTIINNTIPNATHTGDAIGSGNITVVAIQGNHVSTTTPLTNQVLSWNGSVWTPTNLSGSLSSYYAGTGLSLSGNTFLNTMPNVTHTGDAIGSGYLTIVGLQGNPITTISPSFNQVLSWNGSAWSPAANAGQAYYAGTGISISGNTIYHIAHTGDAIGQTNLTVMALQGRVLSTIAPSSNQVLKWDGSMWKTVYEGVFGINGNANTSIGYGAMSSTTGYNNTAYGYYALTNCALTGNNAAFGDYALYYNTRGLFNSAFGSSALLNNSTGSDNSAFGVEALYSNKLGDYNSAIGYEALYSNINGFWNTAVGYEALYNDTIGNYNTAIGYKTLNKDISGMYNTGLGTIADVSSGNLSNATAIGYGAVVNANNKVRIGNTVISVIEGQVSFSAASDSRFKKNIKDIGVGLDFVMKLRPVEYEVNTGDTRLNYGFIAQELLQLVGENNTLVNIGGDADKTLSVRHTDLIAPVVKAIQEQQAIILNQQNQINDKQNQINSQQNQINNLIKENELIKQLLIQKGIMNK